MKRQRRTPGSTHTHEGRQNVNSNTREVKKAADRNKLDNI